jgi:CMP-2-keto-3-deoxyoctulosonic acid synthetase
MQHLFFMHNLFHHWHLQLMEDLEQLKVLENGFKIKVITVDHCAHGVDEPHDVASIEAKIKELEAQALR